MWPQDGNECGASNMFPHFQTRPSATNARPRRQCWGTHCPFPSAALFRNWVAPTSVRVPVASTEHAFQRDPPLLFPLMSTRPAHCHAAQPACPWSPGTCQAAPAFAHGLTRKDPRPRRPVRSPLARSLVAGLSPGGHCLPLPASAGQRCPVEV